LISSFLQSNVNNEAQDWQCAMCRTMNKNSTLTCIACEYSKERNDELLLQEMNHNKQQLINDIQSLKQLETIEKN